jgi:hypothetical protein
LEPGLTGVTDGFCGVYSINGKGKEDQLLQQGKEHQIDQGITPETGTGRDLYVNPTLTPQHQDAESYSSHHKLDPS